MLTKIEAINKKGDVTEIDIAAYLKDKEVYPSDTTTIVITEIVKESEIEIWNI